MKHTQWEYRVITTKSHWQALEDGDIQKALNKLGRRGWEAVSVTPYPGSAGTKYVFVMKRPKVHKSIRVNANAQMEVPAFANNK